MVNTETNSNISSLFFLRICNNYVLMWKMTFEHSLLELFPSLKHEIIDFTFKINNLDFFVQNTEYFNVHFKLPN